MNEIHFPTSEICILVILDFGYTLRLRVTLMKHGLGYHDAQICQFLVKWSFHLVYFVHRCLYNIFLIHVFPCNKIDGVLSIFIQQYEDIFTIQKYAALFVPLLLINFGVLCGYEWLMLSWVVTVYIMASSSWQVAERTVFLWLFCLRIQVMEFYENSFKIFLRYFEEQISWLLTIDTN